MVIEPEFTAGNALGVLQKFHHASFVFGSFCFDVFRVDAIGGIDVLVFFADGAGVFEICWVAGHMDECVGACDFGCSCFFFGGTEAVGKTCILETCEERVEGFAGMAFVRINMAMGIDEHGG